MWRWLERTLVEAYGIEETTITFDILIEMMDVNEQTESLIKLDGLYNQQEENI